MKITVALFLLFSLAGIASAQDPGKSLFASKCALCHSADGPGKTSIGKTLKIPDLHSPDVQKLSDSELKTITTGRQEQDAAIQR